MPANGPRDKLAAVCILAVAAEFTISMMAQFFNWITG